LGEEEPAGRMLGKNVFVINENVQKKSSEEIFEKINVLDNKIKYLKEKMFERNYKSKMRIKLHLITSKFKIFIQDQMHLPIGFSG
jgi:predicted rRNA methylase YqxC with S4 and FtsJ domains